MTALEENQHPGLDGEALALATDVEVGLQASQKWLPPKWFYDERGSELFQRICDTPEYYPTRTERAILERDGQAMVEAMGSDPTLIEFGSGDASKTRLLLARLPQGARYVPVDISGSFLEQVAEDLRRAFPQLEILPIAADYHGDLHELDALPSADRTMLFLGGTIGNHTHPESMDLLRHMRARLTPGQSLLLGTDLRKSPDVLVPAYDDAAGVTAAFNLNVLARINALLDADFDLGAFVYEARWNDAEGRIEMHLVSHHEQTVHVGHLGLDVRFREGESIHTEYSYKYRRSEVEAIIASAGFSRVRGWTDEREWYEVQWLRAEGEADVSDVGLSRGGGDTT